MVNSPNVNEPPLVRAPAVGDCCLADRRVAGRRSPRAKDSGFGFRVSGFFRVSDFDSFAKPRYPYASKRIRSGLLACV